MRNAGLDEAVGIKIAGRKISASALSTIPKPLTVDDHKLENS